MRGRVLVLCALTLLGAALVANAADGSSGYFYKGDVRLDVGHAIAVATDDGSAARTYVYLTAVPLNAAKVAAAFHPDSEVDDQLGAGSTGYVRICIDDEGGGPCIHPQRCRLRDQ